jgi:hypothetical protein
MIKLTLTKLMRIFLNSRTSFIPMTLIVTANNVLIPVMKPRRINLTMWYLPTIKIIMKANKLKL